MSGKTRKIMGCKNKCDLFKEDPIPIGRYKTAKYCRVCEAWFLHERCGIKCACCKMFLSTRARHRKVVFDEKRKKWV